MRWLAIDPDKPIGHSVTAAAIDTAAVFDPASYVTGVPFDALTRLRRDHPVVWVDEPPTLGWPGGPGFWLVLRHADVERVLSQPKLFSSALGGTQTRDPATPDALRYVRRMMLNMDPPEHTRLRRLVTKSFTPRAVAQLEERIQTHANAVVDRVVGNADAGQCDFAKDLAADLPLLTLAEILGVPIEDRMLLFDWANRAIGYQDPDYATSGEFAPEAGTAMARAALRHRPSWGPDGSMPDPRTREGMADLYAYAHLLAEEKRARPADDVMSILLAETDDDGGRLSIEEFENMFWLFAVAGNETLRNGLPGACIGLLDHPAALADLRADPALLPGAIEELLRWWTPVMTFRRTATAPCRLADVEIGAGQKVVVSFTSANRDESVFADPDQVDIRRHPNPHLAFGYGPHFCLGAQLARVQMRALFAAVVARMGHLEYAGQPAFLRSNFQRGVKRLPVRWSRHRGTPDE
ncbi:MAG: cytochrome P450 [Gemmatimonadales bacterium]